MATKMLLHLKAAINSRQKLKRDFWFK